VVVRWSDAEKDTDFMGNLYHLGLFCGANDCPKINWSEVNEGTNVGVCGDITKENKYWKPDCSPATSIDSQSVVWVHDWVNLKKTYAQTMTINATGTETDHPAFAFFVEAVGEYISNYSSSPDVEVEIYTYHPGQIPDLSVYKPTQVFKINAALKSTSASAQYWHVFNLVYKDGKYEIALIQPTLKNGAIKTGWCEIQNDIPDEPKCVLVD